MGQEIDYSRLRDGDVIFTGGTSLIARIIRRVTSKNDQENTATHCGVVVSIGGQKLIAEMLFRGITISSIEKYLNDKKFIVQISRPLYSNLQLNIFLKFIGTAFRKSKSYDKKELVGFLPFVQVDTTPEDYYCSEMTGTGLRSARCMVEFDKEGLISPEFLRVQLEAHSIDWKLTEKETQ